MKKNKNKKQKNKNKAISKNKKKRKETERTASLHSSPILAKLVKNTMESVHKNRYIINKKEKHYI